MEKINLFVNGPHASGITLSFKKIVTSKTEYGFYKLYPIPFIYPLGVVP